MQSAALGVARGLLVFSIMQRHWKGLVVLFASLALAFITALWMESMAFALGSLVAGLVVAFVMSTAWMRPEGHTPEHHHRVDRLVDDTHP